jgi:hypothetical protein
VSQINADWDPRHVGRVFSSIGAKIFSNAAGVACGTRSTWRSQCLPNSLWESDSSNAQSDHDSDAAVKREAEYMFSLKHFKDAQCAFQSSFGAVQHAALGVCSLLESLETLDTGVRKQQSTPPAS